MIEIGKVLVDTQIFSSHYWERYQNSCVFLKKIPQYSPEVLTVYYHAHGVFTKEVVAGSDCV